MISEKDIADFKGVDCTKARNAIKGVSYYNHETNHYKSCKEFLDEFLEQIELIQTKGIKQIPKLFERQVSVMDNIIGNPVEEKYE